VIHIPGAFQPNQPKGTIMLAYAKAIVAVIGVGVTTLLGLIPPDTQGWTILTVASAMLTALAVYLVPNEPLPPAEPRL